MDNLNTRKEKILVSIIRSYVASAVPVGSQALLRSLELDCSSSTIRSEMGDLEELGYLTHPHTSAGRVPTDKGYRYYVDHLSEPTLDPECAQALNEAYRDKLRNADELLRRTLHILSSLSHQTGLVFFPEEEGFIVRTVHLIRLEGSWLMVVWTSASGLTKASRLDMLEPVTDEELSRLLRFLNEEFAGRSFEEIRELVSAQNPIRQESLGRLYTKALRIVEESVLEMMDEKFFVEGSARMLREPEFQRPEDARPVISMLEERGLVSDLTKRSRVSSGVRVWIGREAGAEEFQNCALVSAPFRIGSRTVGSLGVLGPRRMSYEAVIPLVRTAARIVGESFERWLI